MDSNIKFDVVLARCPECGNLGFFPKGGPKKCKVCNRGE